MHFDLTHARTSFVAVKGVVGDQGAPVQVGGEDKAGVLDPLHHSLRLWLGLHKVGAENVREIPVEVEVVGIVPGAKIKIKIKKRKTKRR